MLSIFPLPEEPPDSRLSRLLKNRSELKLAPNLDSCDVILIYTRRWNRVTASQILSQLKPGTTPRVVLCEIAEEPFSGESLFMEPTISGVLTQTASDEQIAAALHAASTGLKVQQQRSNPLSPIESAASLTPRELEVLRLIADGEGNKSIAYLLRISQHTVKFHISSIFEKLNVYSRTEAVKAGILHGLISI